jgi:flagellar basal body-associated protein FliL
MENMTKKKSKLEYLVVFVLIFIVAIFASRIFHILQASSKGCGGSCPVTGTDSKKATPAQNNKGI